LQLAIKYAAKLRRVGLADKLGKLAMDLQEQQEMEEEEKQGGGQAEVKTSCKVYFIFRKSEYLILYSVVHF
jgi:hypothetical protein